MKRLIYFNEEYLPTEGEPQVCVFLSLPDFGWFFLNAPIEVGIQRTNTEDKISLIILGFGITANRNWDV